ncbi:hypothetical protein O181_104526 [Austropuccinia psidii MF-1]|uniref:Uncharacterized protein n=1 Tax=Austropuccinia psidii MF-1 TaxID=1389203 RepID=A0A9Q3JMD9_9BASI|nr:hypothetical protein [Austropuccinia psidii MF-1]
MKLPLRLTLKYRRQEYQCRGEANLVDARASTSSQRLVRDFETLLESPESDITSIPVLRSETLPGRSSRDIPVSVQEMVHGGKEEGVGASSQHLDRKNELINSSKRVTGSRKDTRDSKRFETIVFQRKSTKVKILVEKAMHFIKGSEGGTFPKEEQHPCKSSPCLHKQEYTFKSFKQRQEIPKDKSKGEAKGKGKGKVQVEQTLPS